MQKPGFEAAVAFIASHAAFTGKAHLVRGCEAEIELRHRLGLVDGVEKERLIAILRGERAWPESKAP